MYWQYKHSAKEIAETLSPLFPKIDKAIFTKNIEHNLKALSKDGYFSAEGHKAAEKFGLEVKFIKNPVAQTNVVDDSFLKKAHAKMKKSKGASKRQFRTNP
jgi:hypothetical protein